MNNELTNEEFEKNLSTDVYGLKIENNLNIILEKIGKVHCFEPNKELCITIKEEVIKYNEKINTILSLNCTSKEKYQKFEMLFKELNDFANKNKAKFYTYKQIKSISQYLRTNDILF